MKREHRHLFKAELQLLDGELLVAEQRRRVAELQESGEDTMEAERVLSRYEGTLTAWTHYRDDVLIRLASSLERSQNTRQETPTSLGGTT